MTAAAGPLAGKRVLVTRPRAQAHDLVSRLAAAGAAPVVFPTIEIAPAASGPLDQAVAELPQYQWVIFTSVNGVSAFWDRLQAAGEDSGRFSGIRVAAIGPATARALEKRGVQAQFIPEEYVAERILDGVGDVSGQRVLLPRADIAREALAVELERRGARVNEIAAYHTLPAQPDAAGLAGLRQGVDAATFTSSSTVRNFFQLLGNQAYSLLGNALVACIGPITATTAREMDLAVGLVASEYTMEGLVRALIEHYTGERHESR